MGLSDEDKQKHGDEDLRTESKEVNSMMKLDKDLYIIRISREENASEIRRVIETIEYVLKSDKKAIVASEDCGIIIDKIPKGSYVKSEMREWTFDKTVEKNIIETPIGNIYFKHATETGVMLFLWNDKRNDITAILNTVCIPNHVMEQFRKLEGYEDRR